MDTINDFLNQTFYHNKIEIWLFAFLFALGGFILSKIVYWIFKKFVSKVTAKTKTKVDDLLIDMLEEPIMYAIVILGFWLGFRKLELPESATSFMEHVFTFVFIFNITWLVARTIDAFFQEYLVPLTARSESDFDDQIIPIIRKGVRGLIWSLGIVIGLDNAGFDIMALIAGLGIGGLALALAAQDTVKNIFGGIMIFIDKPFKLNERIKVNGFDGTVQEVGIRSTRIRTLEGRLVTMPNATFSETSIENVTAEPTRKVVLNLGLTYDTTPEKMEEAINTLKTLVVDFQDKIKEDHLISFNNFGDFSLGILFIYYIKPGADIFKTQSEMNLEILKRFNSKGLEFAFPTQTIFKKEL